MPYESHDEQDCAGFMGDSGIRRDLPVCFDAPGWENILLSRRGMALPGDVSGWAPPLGADTVFLYMDTYTSNSANPGRSGTVLCTLHPWKFGPGLSLNSTESGQGSWIRIGKNQFAVTVRRIMVNADGMAVGTVKFQGIVTLITENEFSGTLSAVSYDVDGNQIGPPTPTGNSIGKRIEVETE